MGEPYIRINIPNPSTLSPLLETREEVFYVEAFREEKTDSTSTTIQREQKHPLCFCHTSNH